MIQEEWDIANPTTKYEKLSKTEACGKIKKQDDNRFTNLNDMKDYVAESIVPHVSCQ